MIDFQALPHLDWRMRNSSKIQAILIAGWMSGFHIACVEEVNSAPASPNERPDVFLVSEGVDSSPAISDVEADRTPVDIHRPTDTFPEDDVLIPDTGDAGSLEVEEPEPSNGPLPTLYPANRILSPITATVAENLQTIAFAGQEMQPNVFMKVGASSTVSNANLHCFGGTDVQLDDYSDLLPTIDFFLAGNAGGTNPFERVTEAAKIGMSAGWALTGSPSPLETEIAAIHPSYAFVHYGTNDMGLGLTYESALWKFGDRMQELSDELIAEGIIPILMTIAARGDKPKADQWVSTYNAVIRGIAQSKQIPLLDLHFALLPLEGYGLAGDGIHLNTYKTDGAYRPCDFTPSGLNFGMNMRNLVSLIALDTLRWTLVLQEEWVEDGTPLAGTGSMKDPFVVEQLPFSDSRNTFDSSNSTFDTYTGCQADQDESGTEFVYRLTLDKERWIRALVLDQGTTDIDLHLINSSGTEAGCIARDHQIIEATLQPGTYYFVLDTFVSEGVPMAGDYVFVLLECDAEDSDCKSLLLEDAP